ncbi:MAG: hypothetical protein K8S97_10030 [Anaerolineae bacterium]|nr:hypothetical protein [Anaerolineae bacterium]
MTEDTNSQPPVSQPPDSNINPPAPQNVDAAIPAPSDSDPETQAVIQAEQLINQGKRNEGLALVTKILTTNPNVPKALYIFAQLTQDRSMALQALQNALNLQPNYFEAKLLLERLQSQQATPVPNVVQPPQQTAQPASEQNPLMQQMLMQHHMLMQQQMVNQQQVAQQQMQSQQQLQSQQLVNQQQFAQQNMLGQAGAQIGVEAQNGLAFWIGFIAAIFGFFGVAHIINGKLLAGIMWMILGFVWAVIFAALTLTGIGACITLPLHVVFGYYNAKNGARQQRKVFVSM